MDKVVIDGDDAVVFSSFSHTVARNGRRLHTPAAIGTAVLQVAPGIRIELIERGGSGRRGEYSGPLDMTRSQGYGHWAVGVDDLDAAFAWLLDSGATEV